MSYLHHNNVDALRTAGTTPKVELLNPWTP